MESYTNDTIQREVRNIIQHITDEDFNNQNEKQLERFRKLVESAMENVARQKAIDIKNAIEIIK